MNATKARRRRLEQLLELAQAYRGWSRKELARALGRDPTKLVPGTGIPKLDLVVELAGVLDWPLGDVATFLWDRRPQGGLDANGAGFESLNRAAGKAHRRGRYGLMLELARRAYAAAATPQQRARACNREAGALDGLGRYTEVLAALRRGLAESAVDGPFRRMLQVNLANAYYCLWSLVESGSIARSLAQGFAARPPESRLDHKSRAFAHYVAGHTARRAIALEPQRAVELAATAREDLQRARDLYGELAAAQSDESLEGIANTCRGGLIEVDAVLGRRTPAEALAELAAGLDGIDEGPAPVGDRLESCGWWCIFGCNVALRHLTDERELQRHMAILTNKADEIANRLDNWSMRERVFTMQHTRWRRARQSTGFDIPCVIDTDDVRLIAGTMGRFPAFRDTGWRILQTAQVVQGN